MRIVLCYPVEQHHVAAIRAAMPEAEVVDAGQERIAEALFSADIFCGHAKVPVDWEGVVRQGRLRWIQSSAAGTDHCLVPAVIDSDIVVTSASGVLADQVAEHTVALLTAWCRSLPVFFRAQQLKQFVRRPTRDLHHSTVGIIGLGGVGRRLARLLSLFKTRIVATDMFPIDKPEWVESLWPPERLDDLLQLSSIVVLAAPLNETTRGIINAETLARMRRGALLANMARGPLVATDDLVQALKSGHLGGAVLDVTDPEPLPQENPLWEMPNVIITPHVGGQSARRIDNMTRLFCENLRRWQAGEPLINQLTDKRLGFPVRGGPYPLWSDTPDDTLKRSLH
ncbi:MAG TPA: D-2-hydroxyacid dehydrogenase [Planctomycetaceae bacterium]|nr:D-2-hydroxyacid dehydrogenase [Planctomycetaceae bacterium]